jgi:lipopolysaccharide biosynthesis regulator YciM
VEYQNSAFLPIAVEHLVTCYRNQSNVKALISYLKNIERSYPKLLLVPVLTDLINEVYGTQAALEYLTENMAERPSLEGMKKVLDMKLPSGKFPETYLVDVVEQMVKEKAGFQCSHCGYSANTLYWLCPSCQTWGGMKPK